MKPRELTDDLVHHFRFAKGWLELGNGKEALSEIGKIPWQYWSADVLQVMCQITAQVQNWDWCCHVGKLLTNLAPTHSGGWIIRAHAHYRLGRTKTAYNMLIARADQFKEHAEFCYEVCRYACALNDLKTAELWWDRAVIAAEYDEDILKFMKLKALDDPLLAKLFAASELD